MKCQQLKGICDDIVAKYVKNTAYEKTATRRADAAEEIAGNLFSSDDDDLCILRLCAFLTDLYRKEAIGPYDSSMSGIDRLPKTIRDMLCGRLWNHAIDKVGRALHPMILPPGSKISGVMHEILLLADVFFVFGDETEFELGLDAYRTSRGMDMSEGGETERTLFSDTLRLLGLLSRRLDGDYLADLLARFEDNCDRIKQFDPIFHAETARCIRKLYRKTMAMPAIA